MLWRILLSPPLPFPFSNYYHCTSLNFSAPQALGPTYTDTQLDIIFAMGHGQKRNPVWISTEGNIPEAGSAEANQILGREAGRPDMSKEHGLSHQHSRSGGGGGGGGVGRTLSRRLSSGSRRLSSSHAV